MDALTAALIADGRTQLPELDCWGKSYAAAATREAWCKADLNRAIAAIGGTRGLAHRGRLVVTTTTNVFVWNLEGNRSYSEVAIVTEFATVAEAEAFARRERVGDAHFRRGAEAEAAQAAMDGPTGHGW